MKRLTFEGVRDFDPDDTFGCGQCFRWNKEEDGSYTGVAFGYPANIDYKGGDIIITTSFAAESMWNIYLDLDRDYGEIKALLSKDDEVMREAIRSGEGIRILNQDKWETLISFIISQNNNIARIKGCIESLCTNFGREIGEFKGKLRYDFPSIDTLAGLTAEDLGVCRLGYRAEYIVQTAKLVHRNAGTRLSVGNRLPTDEIRDYLLSLPGVGPKVADCILLFAMRKTKVFPIDVWVGRVMSELYGFDEKDHAGIREYAGKHFYPYGGIAQQYLFNYIRDRGAEQC